MMKYKKYIGSAEVNFEDNTLNGKLLYIKDLVTYEADTPEALEREFRAAVDFYLEDCRADGVEPDVPFKGIFNVRISPETHRSLAISAQTKNWSLNEYVKNILEVHENTKEALPTETHYHFNFEGSKKEDLVSRSPQNVSSKESAAVYYMKNVKPINESSKAKKCH